MSSLAAFHFLRPLWLLGLLLVVVVWWLARRVDGLKMKRYAYMAPHLQDALTVNRRAGRGFRPADMTAAMLACLVLAAAGPAWHKEPSPWFAETAPLIIAIEVSDSMRSNDLLPTRLDRARFKIQDLVARRTGSRTALIAYAGSAHVVLPPTKDAEVLETFLQSLDPAIMPEAGHNAGTVLPLALELLGSRQAIGTILFVNDGFDAGDGTVLADFAAMPDAPALAAWVFGTAAGGVALLPDGSAARDARGARLDTGIDSARLRDIAGEADLPVVRAGSGDGDIRQILRYVESNLRQADDPDAVWRDEAWLMLWPALLLTLLGFRRGWTMQW